MHRKTLQARNERLFVDFLQKEICDACPTKKIFNEECEVVRTSTQCTIFFFLILDREIIQAFSPWY